MLISKRVLIILALVFLLRVNCKTQREIVVKVAEKLNELLPHFSEVLEIGVNENNDLGVYAKYDIGKNDVIFTQHSAFVLPSFEEYYRTYYFTELINGD